MGSPSEGYQVDISAEYGFVCIRFKLKSLGVDPNFAEFIGLDVKKKLMHFYISINLERISDMSDEQLQRLTYSELRKREDFACIISLQWTQSIIAYMVNLVFHAALTSKSD